MDQTDEKTVVESSPTNPLSGLTSEQRHTWQMTGELPGEEPKTADSAPAPSTEDSATSKKVQGKAPSAAKPEGEAVAESEPAATQESKRKGRIQERSAEIDAEIEALHGKLRLRADLRKQVESGEVRPDAPAEKTAAQGYEEGEPTPDQFDTYEAYVKGLAKWTTEKGVAVALQNERAAQKQAAEQARIQESEQAMADDWKKRVAEARKKHPDFIEVALDPELPVFKGTITDGFVLDSEHGAEVLYYLGQHPEELEEINKLNAFAQFRALMKIEASLSEKIPVKKVTSAPPPIREVGGRASAGTNEEDAAVASGDFTRFRTIANAEEISSRKG